ncbi:MAG: succinate dehydrogenase/fumarate reductase iron-sulfur subunit [Methanomassiliicoccales archaeon]|nr:succinate dehydrogenase/fumarate reductase iron-sulfur subunit [Methanomassiliicoccales archaeon]
MSEKMIRFRVSRYDPDRDDFPRFAVYEVPYVERMRILDALNYIHDNYDGTLAYRWVCRANQCGSCTVTVDGKPGPACKTEVPADSDEITIEPLRVFPVIKDLVTDIDRGYDKYMTLRPYLERHSKPKRPEMITAEDIEQIKEFRSCIECWACVSICPVINEVWDEYAGPMSMRKLAELSCDKRDILDRVSVALVEGAYNCTSCKNCWAVCPQEIKIPEKATEKLRARAIEKGLAPLPPHKVAIASIRNYWNPWMAPRGQRVRWAKGYDLPSSAETMFFAGCSPSLLRQNLVENVVKIYSALGEKIGYLGKEERCCSSPLLRVGDIDLFKEMAKANIDAMKKAGAKRVVVTCAGCYKAWKEDYIEWFGDYGIEVVHISEVLENAIRNGKLKLNEVPENNVTVTYHDPCHLGRAGGVYDPPRRVLESIPGVRIVEMSRNRENSACCGSGGGVKTARPNLATTIGGARLEMVRETGAEVIVSCCPWCEQNIEDSIKAGDFPSWRVLDLVDLVAAALEREE